MEPVNRENYTKTFKRLQDTIITLQNRQLQRDLLQQTSSDRLLLDSNIISSIKPTIGRTFKFTDLELRKKELLCDLRKSLLQIAIIESERDIKNLTNDSNIIKERLTSEVPSDNLLNNYQHKLKSELDNNLNSQKKRLNKKVNYFRSTSVVDYFNTSYISIQLSSRASKRVKNKKRKRKNYRNNVKKRKSEALQHKVRDILADNIVVNLSTLDIPDNAILFLANGLKFVPTYNIDKENLTFDLLQFHRKIVWKAYHNELNDSQDNDEWNNNIHKDLYVKKNGYPEYEHPLLDEIKFKLLNFAESVDLSDTRINLSKADLQGRRWILNKVNDRVLYIYFRTATRKALFVYY